MLFRPSGEALMPVYDERNILHIGPPQRAGDPEVTPALADAVRKRIKDVGGHLAVWAILHEDRYNSPSYADDEDDGDSGLSLCGLALNSVDAQRLADLGPKSEFSRWIVKGYQLGLVDDRPAVVNPGASMDGFTIKIWCSSCPKSRPDRPPRSYVRERAVARTARSYPCPINKNGAFAGANAPFALLWINQYRFRPRCKLPTLLPGAFGSTD